MTLEEAIQRLETHKEYLSPHGRLTKEAIDMAIEALKKQIPSGIRFNGDLIDRQALCEYALNQKDKSITPNDIMRFPSAEPELHWIPCSERLPSDYGFDWVLAQIQEDNGYLWIPQVMEYRKAKDDWYSNNEHLGWLKDHNGAFKVVAWMPLPEPYQPKEEE